jgi:hypothetical protein
MRLRIANRMKRSTTHLAWLYVLLLISCAQGQAGPSNPSQTGGTQDIVRVFAQGDSSRLSDFIESCRREFSDHGMKLQLVRSDGALRLQHRRRAGKLPGGSGGDGDCSR